MKTILTALHDADMTGATIAKALGGKTIAEGVAEATKSEEQQPTTEAQTETQPESNGGTGTETQPENNGGTGTETQPENNGGTGTNP